MRAHHDRGRTALVGRSLRAVAERDGGWLALVGGATAALKLCPPRWRARLVADAARASGGGVDRQQPSRADSARRSGEEPGRTDSRPPSRPPVSGWAGGAGASPAAGRDLPRSGPRSGDLLPRGHRDRRGRSARLGQGHRSLRCAGHEQADLGGPPAPTSPPDPVRAPATPGVPPPGGSRPDADRRGCRREWLRGWITSPPRADPRQTGRLPCSISPAGDVDGTLTS